MKEVNDCIQLFLILWILLYPIVGVVVAFIDVIYSWIKDPMHRFPFYMSLSHVKRIYIWILSVTTIGSIVLSMFIDYH